jgi:hypothetical protein
MVYKITKVEREVFFTLPDGRPIYRSYRDGNIDRPYDWHYCTDKGCEFEFDIRKLKACPEEAEISEQQIKDTIIAAVEAGEIEFPGECPKCNQAFAAHNDDGSCVPDEESVE